MNIYNTASLIVINMQSG